MLLLLFAGYERVLVVMRSRVPTHVRIVRRVVRRVPVVFIDSLTDLIV